MALHREFAELLEISEEERKAFKPSPTAYSYTSHMYRSVLSGNFAEILAALFAMLLAVLRGWREIADM